MTDHSSFRHLDDALAAAADIRHKLLPPKTFRSSRTNEEAVFRPAGPSDAEFVDHLTLTTMAKPVRRTWPNPSDQEAYFERNRLAGSEDKTLILVLAETPMTAIGRVTLTAIDHFERGPMVDVEEIHLLPHWQGRGYGAAILKEVISLAEGMPLHLMVLEVNEAQALYRKLGFQPISTDKVRNPHRIEMLWQPG